MERDKLEYLDVDGSVLLKCFKEIGGEDVHGIDLAHYRN